jgi:hypothetical protein
MTVLGPVKDLPWYLRQKLPADTDPEGIAYWSGQEPDRTLMVKEAAYEARAKEAAALLSEDT